MNQERRAQLLPCLESGRAAPATNGQMQQMVRIMKSTKERLKMAFFLRANKILLFPEFHSYHGT